MEIFLALLGLLLSFFFAGSEAAYMAFNNLRLEVWERRKRPFVRTARRFVEHPENFYSTILLGNNTANITYSTFATVLLISYLDETVAWFIITAVVLFFGEIFPKMLFRSYANRIVLNMLLLVRLFYLLGMPLIKLINKLISMFYRVMRIPGESVQNLFSREELRIILEEEGEQADYHRQRYISNVLELSTAKVTEAMTPRTEIISATDNISWEGLLDIMIESGKNHIPVFKESLDNITGIVFLYDMLEPDIRIETIIKPVQFIPETKNCSELLREFQENNRTLAVIIDEYGGTKGLVTLNDLIEVVFGEFLDPYENFPVVKALNDHTWMVDARVDLEELDELIGAHFPEGDYETLAGFILDRLGHIPKPGDTLVMKHIRIEIEEASPKKIYKVKLIKKLKR